MIMEMNGDKIQTNMATGGHKFSIDSNSPAAFKVLMDGLYKFAIRAIVRELATNAIDASKQKGLDPMDWTIQLPNAANPMFSIEDKGVGINEQDIYDVYCVLFKSTKSGTNDQTGMFGLGSKTPFAYTRQFVITSACDGMKKTYSAGYGPDDIPFVTKVGEVPSNETGLKVMFAVMQKDFNDFYDAFTMSAIAWPGLPKILGASEYYAYLRRSNYIDDGKSAFEKTVQLYHGNKLPEESRDFFIPINAKFCIEMGSVIYSIDDDVLDDASKAIIRKADGHFIIHAPIGAVDITPNREELKYTEKTIKFLNTEITSTYIIGIGAPSEKDGWRNNENFFSSREFDIMTKAQNVNKVAEKVVKDALKMQKTHEKKTKALDAYFDKNAFYSTWSLWDKYRNDKTPFGKMNVRSKRTITPASKAGEFAKTFLIQISRKGAYMFSECTAKDVAHINIKNGDSIDSAYFVTKVRSFIKDHSTDKYDLKGDGVFIFSKAGLYDIMIADSYYGVTSENARKTSEFASMANTYPKRAKVVEGTEPVWQLECTNTFRDKLKNLWKGYGEVTMNDVNKIIQNFPNTKLLYCGRIQSKKILVKDSELKNKKIAFKNLNSENDRISFRNLIESLYEIDGIDEDVMVVSGTINNLRKYELWNNGFESATEYVLARWDKAVQKVHGWSQNITSCSPVWCFEKFTWNGAKDFIKNNLKPTSVFKQLYDSYSATGNSDEIRKAFHRVSADDYKTLKKWSNVDYSATNALVSEIDNNLDNSDQNDTATIALEKLLTAYPMFKLVHNEVKPYSAERGWDYSDRNGEYCKLFLEYVKMIDN